MGHSDADVLAHAVSDALLGAAALGDIGKHFPDTDDTYKNADSMVLLSKVCDLLKENGYSVGNIDATVLAQSPKLAPYIAAMRTNIAKACKIPLSDVSVKRQQKRGLALQEQRKELRRTVCVL